MLAGRQADETLSFGDCFKILYPVANKCFHVLMLYLMLDGLILLQKGDFHCIRCL